MIDTDKYESKYWDEEMNRIIAALSEDNWDSGDGDVHEIVTHLVAEVKRLRGILGDITAIDEWGGDGKDVGITITYSEGDSFMGWLNKCDDEVIE